ncbi:hypothetical protein B0H14DRAFT_1284232 [Mycena olivaceomarginata]|nr:hypothetical protein B0H14DRAFT_1284232 [Mycena olivaceomarginata]
MLAEIFYNFLPIYPVCSDFVDLQSPTLLSQVCRRWRNIALSLPRLWRAIKLDIVREFHPQQLDLLRTWLGRSGDCLLSIAIAYRTIPSILIDHHVGTLLQELMHHSRQWEYVEIEVPFNIIPLIQGELPCLQVLTISRTQKSLRVL